MHLSSYFMIFFGIFINLLRYKNEKGVFLCVAASKNTFLQIKKQATTVFWENGAGTWSIHRELHIFRVNGYLHWRCPSGIKAGASDTEHNVWRLARHPAGGDPYGTRTHIFAVRGRRLSRLTKGPCLMTLLLYHNSFQIASLFSKFFSIFLIFFDFLSFVPLLWQEVSRKNAFWQGRKSDDGSEGHHKWALALLERVCKQKKNAWQASKNVVYW